MNSPRLGRAACALAQTVGPNGAARLLGLNRSTARFRIRKLGLRREEYLG
jgi:DNA-binding protein Fis